jgi:hypothetical protein
MGTDLPSSCFLCTIAASQERYSRRYPLFQGEGPAGGRSTSQEEVFLLCRRLHQQGKAQETLPFHLFLLFWVLLGCLELLVRLSVLLLSVLLFA